MRTAQRAVESAFTLIARLRSARALHPRGAVLDGRLTLDPGSLVGAALGGPRTRPAVVRVSKSVGTPGRLPDLLGVALRVPTGDTGVLDVLLASAGRRGLAHLALLPSGRWWGRPYSTLLPYRTGGRLVVLGLDAGDAPATVRADPAAAADAVRYRPVTLTVTEMRLGGVRPVGRRRPIGRLVLESVRADGPPLTFDPVLNRLPELGPARPLSALREWAYSGSRRGRGAEPAALRRRP